jgi:hypothetical protein
MQPRIDNPVMTAPGAMQALQQLSAATKHAGIPEVTLVLAINAWNRINAATRQITGEWVSQLITSSQGAVQPV